MSTETHHHAPGLKRAAHKPGADYGRMSDAELMALREAYLEEIRALENPGPLTRLWRRGVQAAGAVAAFAGGMWLSGQAFLNRERAAANLRPQPPAPEPAADDSPGRPLQRMMDALDEPAPDDYERRWSCAGCPAGCANGMGGGCFPTFVRKDHPRRELFPPVTDEQIATMHGNRVGKDYPAYNVAFFRTHPGHERAQMPGLKERLEAEGITFPAPEEPAAPAAAPPSPPGRTLERQTVFATVASTGAAVGVAQWLAKRMTGKEAHHIHHLKHEVQHMEDEWFFRRRLEEQRNAPPRPAVPAVG